MTQQVIYRYPLRPERGLAFGKCRIRMPKNSTFCAVKWKQGEINLWMSALQPFEEYVEKVFCIVPTGLPVDGSWAYYDTLIDAGGIVYHVLEDWESEKVLPK